jgi:hypothetical protein
MLQYAVPPGYQRQQPIKRPKLGPWLGVIDGILNDDKQRTAKQRHTAKRIFDAQPIGESVARDFALSGKALHRDRRAPEKLRCFCRSNELLRHGMVDSVQCIQASRRS